MKKLAKIFHLKPIATVATAIVFLAIILSPISIPKPVLADPDFLDEASCNAMDGWHWYVTNGREGCWSKTLADSVSWNKNVNGLDGCTSDNCTASSGAYACNTDYTLQQRMEAATKITGNGTEWWKIVSNVGGIPITSSHDGSAGYSVISALAIADCIDGIHDLGLGTGSGTQIVGNSWSERNTTLRTWAGASGKSALPYCDTSAGACDTQTTNDYWDACSQNDGNDLPLNCSPQKTFYRNEKVCTESDQNSSYLAAVSIGGWEDSACIVGYESCSAQSLDTTSQTFDYLGFRVVVRPFLGDGEAVPEFTTITLIIAAVAGLGIYFLIRQRKMKKA